MTSKTKFGILSMVLGAGLGCQGGMSSFPNLSNLNSPSRVPPPGVGSYQAPSNYSDSRSGGATASGPATPTFGQLRKMESGDRPEPRFTQDNVTEFSMNDGTQTVKPSLAAPIPSPRAAYPIQSTVQQASATSTLTKDSPPIMMASEVQARPSASVATLSDAGASDLSASNDEVRWRKP